MGEEAVYLPQTKSEISVDSTLIFLCFGDSECRHGAKATLGLNHGLPLVIKNVFVKFLSFTFFFSCVEINGSRVSSASKVLRTPKHF